MLTFLEMVRLEGRQLGIPLTMLEVDLTHPQAIEAVESRSVPKPLSFGTMLTYFRPTLFRWRMDGGDSGTLLMHPIIRPRMGGPYYELDGVAMARQLLDKLLAHYPPQHPSHR